MSEFEQNVQDVVSCLATYKVWIEKFKWLITKYKILFNRVPFMPGVSGTLTLPGLMLSLVLNSGTLGGT